jgi:hypothetical protein
MRWNLIDEKSGKQSKIGAPTILILSGFEWVCVLSHQPPPSKHLGEEKEAGM